MELLLLLLLLLLPPPPPPPLLLLLLHGQRACCVPRAANERRGAATTREAAGAERWQRAAAVAGALRHAPSIFFMADSVVKGNFRIWYWSSLLTRGTERRRYFGLRSRRSVFGLWNAVL